MNTRTISRLPPENNIQNDDLLYISKHLKNDYISKNIQFGTLFNTTWNNIESELHSKYNLSTDSLVTINENIKTNEDRIDTLSSSVNSLSTSVDDISRVIPSWSISDITTYIAPEETNKVVGKDFLIMNFSEGKTYSSEETTSKTGNLFCYGWLTAPKTLDPARAWVAVEANVRGTWIMIGLQPWVIGNKSSVMQYVGFNVPVQKGMSIRISTGFQIEDYDQSFSGRGLVLNVQSESVRSNINNAFIGYILG